MHKLAQLTKDISILVKFKDATCKQNFNEKASNHDFKKIHILNCQIQVVQHKIHKNNNCMFKDS